MTLMFKWVDGSEHDFDALPEASRKGGVQRFVSHVAGNEVASLVTGWVKTQIAGKDRKVESVTTQEVKDFRGPEDGPNRPAINAKTVEFQALKLKQILNGELGVRTGGGPRIIDPVAREVRRIAEEELGIILGSLRDDTTGKPITLPRGETVLTIGNVALDRAGWVARWVGGNDMAGKFGPKGEHNEPRIKRIAERVVAAAKSKADKAQSVDVSAAEALGL